MRPAAKEANLARILLVDDEELVRRVVRVVLEAEGYEVLEAADGQDALRVASETFPAAVVLDLLIPGSMDGFEICRQLKSTQPETRVLVLSSVPLEQADKEAKAAGADEVMSKPFSALDLIHRLALLVA